MELLIGSSSAPICRSQSSAFSLCRASAASPRQQAEQGGNAVPAESFRLEPTKKVQRRKPQWSRGDAPGEYGGPPLDLEIRPSWGGPPAEDPLAARGAYIWNKAWQPYLETPPSKLVPPKPSTAKEPDSGFLSLSRSISLESIDVDLSEELMKPSKATLQRQLEEAERAVAAASQKDQPAKPRWRFAPTQREEQQWARGRKAATGGSEVMSREVEKAQIDVVADAERQRLWYIELKKNLQLLTLGIGGLGTTCAYFAYSPEIAGSYGAGLIGALVYVRMLGNSVDGFGSKDAGGAARGALGAPRLLVPVVLVMIYSRWNALLVPQYGLMHLHLIPMLVGFFTYKAATIVETFKEFIPSLPLREDKELP